MKQSELKFSPRLFQRGFNRRECVETWSFKRPSFLAQLKKTRPLPKLSNVLTKKDEPMRIVVIYSSVSLDSFFVVPYAMETFQACRQIQVRYFAFEQFFPFFYDKVERTFPQFFILNSDGSVKATWGPRVETSEKVTWNDESLSQFAIKHYPKKLDDSLTAFFKQAFPS